MGTDTAAPDLRPMVTSATGRAFTEGQEGLRLEPYLDQLGYPTIGYGHRIYVPSLAAAIAMYPNGMSAAEADATLSNDLKTSEAAVNDRVSVDISQGVFDALVDLCFNCGAHCLYGTKCLAALNAGDLATARAEFLGFCHGTDPRTGQKVELPVLVQRRKLAAAQLWDK